jgi:hypothetical protein
MDLAACAKSLISTYRVGLSSMLREEGMLASTGTGAATALVLVLALLTITPSLLVLLF